MQKSTSNHPTSSAGGLRMYKPPSFPPNRSPKNAGTKHFMLGGKFGVIQTGADNGLRSTLADFYQIKVRQPVGRKDSILAVCQKISRLDGGWIFA
jgi:hypothetical protein